MEIHACAIAIALALFAAEPSAAEIFKYVDESGVMQFTDDRSKLPSASEVSTIGRRAYACDNPTVGGRTPCFLPDDPLYMTVALKARPAGDTIHRTPDTGDGLAITVLEETRFFGSKWLRVRMGAQEGWIAAAFTRHTDE